jgi:hypothetical protein
LQRDRDDFEPHDLRQAITGSDLYDKELPSCHFRRALGQRRWPADFSDGEVSDFSRASFTGRFHGCQALDHKDLTAEDSFGRPGSVLVLDNGDV